MPRENEASGGKDNSRGAGAGQEVLEEMSQRRSNWRLPVISECSGRYLDSWGELAVDSVVWT